MNLNKKYLQSCPLCGSVEPRHYHEDKIRPYYQCGHCSLVFVPPSFHITDIEEKAIYDLHENNPSDPGYRKFHSRLFNPLIEKIEENSRGLDFGCGPGSALSAMLEESGHHIEKYDRFYAPDASVLEYEYDFICAVEVVEHLSAPLEVLRRLYSIIRENGFLCIMTKMVINHDAFAQWHYTHDRSHIVFFSRETFRFLADLFHADLSFPDKDVIFLQKRKYRGNIREHFSIESQGGTGCGNKPVCRRCSGQNSVLKENIHNFIDHCARIQNLTNDQLDANHAIFDTLSGLKIFFRERKGTWQ